MSARTLLDRLRAAALGALGGAALLACGPLHAQDTAEDDGGWDFDDLDEPEPTLFELFQDQALEVGLFAAFATLAMVSFFKKSKPLKYVALVASVLYLGVYKSLLLSVVNIFGSLSAALASLDLVEDLPGSLPIFAYSIGWYAFAIFAVVTTVLWGRVYCGRICAFGALTQLIDAVVPKRFQIEVPPALERRASYIKYGILFGAIGYYFVTHEIVFYRYIEPFWLFTFQATTPLWIGLGVLLVASIFVRNLYCRFLCPLGAALGLLSTLSVFRIKRWSACSQCALCEKTCEWGAIRNRKIVMTECVRCDDCERLYHDKARCPHWLLKAKGKAWTPPKPQAAARPQPAAAKRA